MNFLFSGPFTHNVLIELETKETKNNPKNSAYFFYLDRLYGNTNIESEFV